MWRKETRKLFWFMRAPDWFVWLAASQPDDGSEDEIQDFFDEAFNERCRRMILRNNVWCNKEY